MQIDTRLTSLAENVLKKSIKLKKGEKIYIEAFSDSTQDLLKEFIRVATEIGAVPFYFHNNMAFMKNLIENSSLEQMQEYGKMHAGIMAQCDAYAALRGFDDVFAFSDVKPEKMEVYQKYFVEPVHNKIRVPQTRWCVMRYPNNTMSALSRMSTRAFEEFFFKACLVDYSQMEAAMEPLNKLICETDKVKIIAKDTELEFSLKGMSAISSHGGHNIPDGEVFTAPVKNSINGSIQFNTDTTYEGEFFSNIRLEFEKGKIIKGTSLVNNQRFQQMLDLDAGSRYMGEFAFGLNPHVLFPILDPLFDEKISGSIHMAIGNSYDDMDNGNKSSIHWDIVQIQTPEFGGGEIWFDDVLIRKDGRFVQESLLGLNPENLK